MRVGLASHTIAKGGYTLQTCTQALEPPFHYSAQLPPSATRNLCIEIAVVKSFCPSVYGTESYDRSIYTANNT